MMENISITYYTWYQQILWNWHRSIRLWGEHLCANGSISKAFYLMSPTTLVTAEIFQLSLHSCTWKRLLKL